MSEDPRAGAGSGQVRDAEPFEPIEGRALVDEEPAFYTVLEAALILRIGRTSAYRLAKLYLLTDGEQGLPVVEVGGLLRVPRVALERQAGGPVHLPATRAAG